MPVASKLKELRSDAVTAVGRGWIEQSIHRFSMATSETDLV
jgi:hypothetical protein